MSSTTAFTPPAVKADTDRAMVMRQALAGMLWSKQYFYYDLNVWLEAQGWNRSAPEIRDRCATESGSTCTTTTLSRCRISGSIPGTPRGIWRFTCSRSRQSTRLLRSRSSLLILRNTINIRMARYPRMSGTSAIQIPRSMPMQQFFFTAWNRRCTAKRDLNFLKRCLAG